MKDVKLDEQLEDRLYFFFSKILDLQKQVKLKEKNVEYGSIWEFWDGEL